MDLLRSDVSRREQGCLYLNSKDGDPGLAKWLDAVGLLHSAKADLLVWRYGIWRSSGKYSGCRLPLAVFIKVLEDSYLGGMWAI